MVLPRDLSSQHAKLDANISIMRGRLASTHDEGVLDEEVVSQLAPWTDQIGQMLRGFLRAEERVLLRQATRVLGETLEEVSEINEQHAELVDLFDRFADAVGAIDVRTANGALEGAREYFDEFCACFERHRDAERNFYSLYSTILFPAGSSTD